MIEHENDGIMRHKITLSLGMLQIDFVVVKIECSLI